LKRSFGRGGDSDEEPTPKGELGFLPERTCAICYSDQNPAAGGGSEAEILAATAGGGVVGSVQTDITNPYEAIPCGDVYCFSCLAERIEAQEGEGWICLRCGELVKECKPWSGDVIDEAPRPGSGSGKNVGFSVEDIEGKGGINGEEQEELREMEPMPTEDEMEEREEDEINGVNGNSSLVDVDRLGESADWARSSEYIDRTADTETETETGASDYLSDDQSEEYDEEANEMDDYEA